MPCRPAQLAPFSLVLALLLAGCGGGGGVATVSSTPPPSPAPTPPPPISYDTAEYRRSNGAVQVQALAAYTQGASGRGVTVAVIDSGVNPALSEFAGRISPASRDVAGTRPLGDERGHGTSVSGVLLAARDGAGIHGVAPEATLLALRADTPGSCTDTGCSYASTAIATGLDAAVAGGARIVNMSLGGGGTSAGERAAAGRVAAAGIVLVLSAGNEALPSADAFASQLVAVAPATTLVVGAVDSGKAIASFSNRAGALAANYLVAPGVDIRSFNQDGVAYLYSGTSVAAPIVAGAAALLAQAFPNLTGAQIADILLRTADDLGAPGTDEIYGRGMLNIARAFQPLGGLTSVGSGQRVMITPGGTLGGALGDGGPLRGALAAVPALDGYGRAYRVNLAGSLAQAPAGRLAATLLAQPVEQAATASAGGSAAFALFGDNRSLWAGDRATMAALAPGQQVQASPVGHVRLGLAGGTALVAGHGEAVSSLVALADASAAPLPLVTADPVLPFGSRALGGSALAGRLGDFTLAAGFGQSVLPAQPRQAAALQSTFIARLSRRWAGLELAALLRVDDERGSLMGTRLASGFGLAGGTTASLGVSGRLALGRFHLAGEWRRARSRLALQPGIITAASALAGDAASLSLSGASLFAPGDSLLVAVTRPLALGGLVEIAGLADAVRAGPSARETATELLYGVPLAGGQMQLSLFHRDNPAHIAGSPDDDGAALRLFFRW